MNVPVIHVHSQSDKSTIGYVQFMWETMRALATHPEALKLSLHCIGPTATERLKDLPQTKTYYVPNAEVDKGMSGSTAHGACVEHAIQMFDDGDIHVVCDSDTVVLARGWDDYVRSELLDKKVGIIGTTYEEVGGFTSGGGNVQTYKGIPTMAWVAFSPLHKWRDLRVMPKKGDDIQITNEGMAKIYGLPIGYRVLRDVGWQVPEYLASRGISYTGWKQRKGSKDAIVLRGLSDYHEEYHVTYGPDSLPFVVHHRGSLRHAYRGDRISQNFYNAVDKYLVDEKLHAMRWSWVPSNENRDALQLLEQQRAQSVVRNADFEKMAGVVPPTAGAPPPMQAGPQPPQASGNTQNQAIVGGWLKATMDGNSIWGRYNTPVPQVINVEYVPSQVCRHVRLEGTVSGVHFQLPPAPSNPHTLTVRNMTGGPVTFRVPEGQGKLTCEVPMNCCWQLLVDVDGVIHIT